MTADELRTLRKEAGLTQRQLADAIGVSQANVSQWENGVQAVTGPASIAIGLVVAKAVGNAAPKKARKLKKAS